jgi:hypothetical protein
MVRTPRSTRVDRARENWPHFRELPSLPDWSSLLKRAGPRSFGLALPSSSSSSSYTINIITTPHEQTTVSTSGKSRNQSRSSRTNKKPEKQRTIISYVVKGSLITHDVT